MESVQLFTSSPEDTEALGESLASQLGAGAWLGLNGDLGTGKTCLVRGLARGLGVPGDVPVTSPTFTLLNVYPGKLPVFHLDLYRLLSEDDLEAIGYYDLFVDEGVVVVEWSDRIAGVAPPKFLRIALSQEGEGRRLLLEARGWSSPEFHLLRQSLSPWLP